MSARRLRADLRLAVAALAIAALGALAASPLAAADNTMLVQPDGKVLLGGYASPGFGALVRYQADGSLDPAFGRGGIAIDHRISPIEALALAPDGAILAAASRFGSASPPPILARYLPNGSADTAFSGASPFEPVLGAQASAIAPRGDGSIALAVNHCCFKYGPPSTASLELFSASGAFGGQLALLSSGGWGGYGGGDYAFSDLLARAGGSLSGVGTAPRPLPSGGTARAFAAFQFVDGGPRGLDPGYGDNGVALGPDGDARGGSLDQDKALVVGNSPQNVPGPHAQLARFDLAGGLDQGFGAGGVVELAPAGSVQSWLSSALVAGDGSILAVGTAYAGFSPEFGTVAPCPGCSQALLVKLNAAGGLDPSFGEGGVVRLGGGAVPAMYGEDVALAPGGGILVSGRGEGADPPFVLAKLTASGALDQSFGEGGVVSTSACAGTEKQRRASGCLPSARVSLQVQKLRGRRPLLRLHVRPSASWARVASVQLILPRALRLNLARAEAGAGFSASVPGRRVEANLHPRSVNLVRNGYAPSLSLTLRRPALRRATSIRRGHKLPFRVRVKFGEPARQEGQQTVVLRRAG